MTKKLRSGLQPFCWRIMFVLLSALAVLSVQAMTGRERVYTDHGTYVTGETIKVGFTNGPANPTDWIGIYKEGEVPGRTGITSVKYLYVGGSGSAGAGLATGEVTFTGGLSAAGNYVAYLLEKDGYRVLAEDKFTVIEPAAPQVRTSKHVYAKGDPISVTFSRGPGNARDFIAIYAEGEIPGLGIRTALKYVDGTDDGMTGLANGTVAITTSVPLPPGNWVAYLMENDSDNILAQEAFHVVLTGSGLATVVPDHSTYLPNQPVRITFDGGRGSTSDWVGVYKAGELPDGVSAYSTDWAYVGGTQNYGLPLTSGEVLLDGGFAGPQNWRVYFLLNDAYEITGVNTFQTVDASSPIVQTSKRLYDVAESISIAFTNAPGNAKDWIGIYPRGVDPAGPGITATRWNYTDGTRTGTAGIVEGELAFTGLDADEWTVYLFENDGYTILAREDFSVRPSGALGARVVSVTPADDSVAGPSPTISVVLENRDTTVNTGSISVKLDGVTRTFTQSVDGARITLTAPISEVLPKGSAHTLTVSFVDSAGATVTSTTDFTVDYNNITLPTPLFLETFESVAEGSLPAGWVASNQSGTVEVPPDLGHLGSSTYNNFVVVDSARLGGDFLTYGDGTPETRPIAQVLTPGQATVVNGSVVRNFAQGKILFALSGYHGGVNEIMEVTTPDYNLTGKQNIYLSFHSLYEQNQDNIAGIEVSNDGGVTWRPVIYYLDPADIIRVNNVIDAEATFNTTRADIALFPDGSGGTYGSFLKASIADAAAHVQPRINDDPANGTRVEYIRVPEADNKPAVRFRLFYAGADSWYWGVDNFGIYSQNIVVDYFLTISRNGSSVTLSYDPATTLESTTALGPNAQWTSVSGAANGTYTTTTSDTMRFYRTVRN